MPSANAFQTFAHHRSGTSSPPSRRTIPRTPGRNRNALRSAENLDDVLPRQTIQLRIADRWQSWSSVRSFVDLAVAV